MKSMRRRGIFCVSAAVAIALAVWSCTSAPLSQSERYENTPIPIDDIDGSSHPPIVAPTLAWDGSSDGDGAGYEIVSNGTGLVVGNVADPFVAVEALEAARRTGLVVQEIANGFERFSFEVDDKNKNLSFIDLPREQEQELIVLGRRDEDVRSGTRGPTANDPDCGSLLARRDSTCEELPLPLRHTDVRAQLDGPIASVRVRQEFHNPFDTKIEARYVFPLPHDAAVSDFILTIGTRRIRGIIRERKEAERIYQAARARGHVATLLEEERPNIFEQKVANIEPGKAIEVAIDYFNLLPYRDGSYEFAFPLVVGPRYNPAGVAARGAGVGAVAHTAAGSSGQEVEVTYLKPGERSGHDVSLTVDIAAGVSLGEIESPSHKVEIDRNGERRARVTLASGSTIANRDFVLRYQVAGDATQGALLTHCDERGGFFSLLLVPPRKLERIERAPMEFVFVIDCSGSMQGAPLELAKGVVRRLLKKLESDDSFQIIQFSNVASTLGDASLRATRDNVRRGLAYLDDLQSEGGTEMLAGVRAALELPSDDERARLVTFLTDGFIGNEGQVFAAVAKSVGQSRLFSVGIGNSVNRHLLAGMARLGRGTTIVVGTNESATQAADQYYERLRHPALERIEIDWGGLKPEGLAPARVSTLFAGQPILITGRFEGSPPAAIHVRGRAGGKRIEYTIRCDGEAERDDNIPALASIWARRRIEQLSDAYAVRRDEIVKADIRALACRYNLLSAETSFIAVDSASVTDGDHGVTVPVAVPVPAGVRYDTTVGGGRKH
ncbi:MAG: VIT domain-containing protein [Planctomycetota bacterium]